MAKKRIEVEIGVRNKLAAGMKSVMASVKGFARSVRSSLSAVGLSFRRVAMIGIGSLAAMIRHGNMFRAQMAEVQTMLGSDKSMLPELTRQVRELAAEFGLAKDTLAKGLYNALSAGVPAGNAIDFLRVASKAAIGGVTDVDTAVDGLTTVLNAYGIEAARVSQVSDIMFTVVKEGKITFGELAQSIGVVAPSAKLAGVGIEELSAMIATLVKVDKPERAMTALRQAMTFAAQQGKPLLQVLEEFEGKSLEDLLKAGVSQKSAAGIAILSGNIGVLRKELKIFENTAGAANAAFEDIEPIRGWQRLWQSVLSIVSQLGEELDTAVMPTIDRLTERIQALIRKGVIDRWVNQAVDAMKEFGDALGKAAGVIREIIDSRFEIMWIAIAFYAGRALVAVAKFGTAAYAAMLGMAAAKTGLIAFAAGFVSLVGLGIAGFFLTVAGAVAYAGKKLFEMRKATRDLIRTMRDLNEMESGMRDKYGTRHAATLGRIRRTMQSGTAEEKATVERLFPKAVAEWRKGAAGGAAGGAADAAIMPKIGLGNGTGKGGGGGISAETSMLSTGDLFTMMQAGAGFKRESELSELQEINQGIQDLIGLSGGVE